MISLADLLHCGKEKMNKDKRVDSRRSNINRSDKTEKYL